MFWSLFPLIDTGGWSLFLNDFVQQDFQVIDIPFIQMADQGMYDLLVGFMMHVGEIAALLGQDDVKRAPILPILFLLYEAFSNQLAHQGSDRRAGDLQGICQFAETGMAKAGNGLQVEDLAQ